MIIGGLSVALMFASLSVSTHYLTNRLVNTSSIDAPAGGNSNINGEYTSNATISENQTITSGSYDSSEADQNALLVTGENEVTVENVTVSKTEDSDGGDADDGTSLFSASNSRIITNQGDTFYITNTTAVIDLESKYRFYRLLFKSSKRFMG